MLTVVALGGNALLGPRERGTAAEQRGNLASTFAAAKALLTEGPVVITHGNRPQVGNELLRQELASAGAPPPPGDPRGPHPPASSPLPRGGADPGRDRRAHRLRARARDGAAGRGRAHPRRRRRRRPRLRQPDEACRALLRRRARASPRAGARLGGAGGREPRLATCRLLSEAARDSRARADP